MEIDFGSAEKTKQNAPALYDVEGNEIGGDCQVTYEVDSSL